LSFNLEDILDTFQKIKQKLNKRAILDIKRSRKGNIMSGRRRQYCIIEHLWRLIRAIFLLLGTGLWLYTNVSPHLIFACFVLAIITDQLHGLICRMLEKLLKYKVSHDNWE
jgi:hypothetical protein